MLKATRRRAEGYRMGKHQHVGHWSYYGNGTKRENATSGKHQHTMIQCTAVLSLPLYGLLCGF